MFENPRRGRQARNFTTNVPKILDIKSSTEQIFSKNCRWVPLFLSNAIQCLFPLGSFPLHANWAKTDSSINWLQSLPFPYPTSEPPTMCSKRLEVMGTRENKARERDTREERCFPRVPCFFLHPLLPRTCYPQPHPQTAFSQATNVAITLTRIDSKENHVYKNSY